MLNTKPASIYHVPDAESMTIALSVFAFCAKSKFLIWIFARPTNYAENAHLNLIYALGVLVSIVATPN